MSRKMVDKKLQELELGWAIGYDDFSDILGKSDGALEIVARIRNRIRARVDPIYADLITLARQGDF